MTVDIIINGVERSLVVEVVEDLIASLSLPDRGVAIAVNDSVVPKARWNKTKLEPGQRIEILTAVQGG